MEPEIVADYPLVIGENPLWHFDEKKVYWIDIHTVITKKSIVFLFYTLMALRTN